MHKTETTLPNTSKIQWHPGFYAATEIELRQNRSDLEFHREYNLSKKPLQIDLLIIEKLNDITLQNEIGAIFRKYNIIEYKSPEDSLNIDDFFKTVGYAYLYKGLGETVNQIPLNELTVSLFHETKPLKMMHQLSDYGCIIQSYAPGIYRIQGLLISAQLVITRELQPELHPALKVLTHKLKRSDLFIFMEYANSFTDPGDRQNADAVLQISVSANKELYNQIRRSDMIMCDALRELFKDELEDAHEKGKCAGLSEGISKGKIEGENRLKLLYSKLEQDGRREEIFQTLSNPEFLEKLYKEYGID